MALTKRAAVALLLLALLPTLFAPALFPAIRLLFLAPAIVWLYYKLPFQGALWTSFSAGLLIDLLSSDYRFGMIALTYTATTALLYRQKRHFYAQGWSTLPILTWLFALLSTTLQVVLLAMIDEGLPIGWRWAATDLLLLPIADSCWALLGFALPLKLLQWRPTRRRTYQAKRPK